MPIAVDVRPVHQFRVVGQTVDYKSLRVKVVKAPRVTLLRQLFFRFTNEIGSRSNFRSFRFKVTVCIVPQGSDGLIACLDNVYFFSKTDSKFGR